MRRLLLILIWCAVLFGCGGSGGDAMSRLNGPIAVTVHNKSSRPVVRWLGVATWSYKINNENVTAEGELTPPLMPGESIVITMDLDHAYARIGGNLVSAYLMLESANAPEGSSSYYMWRFDLEQGDVFTVRNDDAYYLER